MLFIKDVIGDEICCWSFYGQGRKLAEVCCTSIVYATEKKQTKVWGASPAWLGAGYSPGAEGGVHFALLSFPNLLGKEQGQCKGLGERQGTICAGPLTGRGCREGHGQCSGKDWIFAVGTVQV